MEEIVKLVCLIQQPETGKGEKQLAFGKLVTQLQDMAYGCAYAILGDRSLAEEAAQDAFLVVWTSLPKLHQPEAFITWFRRILVTQCGRQTRKSRVQTVSLHSDLPLFAPDTHSLAVQSETQALVWRAIYRLPKTERIVTILFHINNYSQSDIAAFLDVSESTVKRKLTSARKALKEGILRMAQDDLLQQRPSRDAQFAVRVAAFTQRFSALIEEGQSIVRSLLVLAEEEPDVHFKGALIRLRIDIEQGATLSEAMTRQPEFFENRYIQRVEHGERGDLRAMLRIVANGNIATP